MLDGPTSIAAMLNVRGARELTEADRQELFNAGMLKAFGNDEFKLRSYQEQVAEKLASTDFDGAFELVSLRKVERSPYDFDREEIKFRLPNLAPRGAAPDVECVRALGLDRSRSICLRAEGAVSTEFTLSVPRDKAERALRGNTKPKVRVIGTIVRDASGVQDLGASLLTLRTRILELRVSSRNQELGRIALGEDGKPTTPTVASGPPGGWSLTLGGSSPDTRGPAAAPSAPQTPPRTDASGAQPLTDPIALAAYARFLAPAFSGPPQSYPQQERDLLFTYLALYRPEDLKQSVGNEIRTNDLLASAVPQVREFAESFDPSARFSVQQALKLSEYEEFESGSFKVRGALSVDKQGTSQIRLPGPWASESQIENWAKGASQGRAGKVPSQGERRLRLSDPPASVRAVGSLPDTIRAEREEAARIVDLVAPNKRQIQAVIRFRLDGLYTGRPRGVGFTARLDEVQYYADPNRTVSLLQARFDGGEAVAGGDTLEPFEGEVVWAASAAMGLEFSQRDVLAYMSEFRGRSASNEFERKQLEREGRQAIQKLGASYAPDSEFSFQQQVRLPDYDFGKGGFEFKGRAYLPRGGTVSGQLWSRAACLVTLENATSVTPDPLFVPVEPEIAQNLVSAPQRSTYVSGRYRLVSLASTRRGCAIGAELLSLSLFADPGRTELLLQLPQEGVGGRGGREEELPAAPPPFEGEAVLAAASAMGLELDQQQAIQYAQAASGVGYPANEFERMRLEQQGRDAVKKLAESYVPGTEFSFEATVPRPQYDFDRGGFELQRYRALGGRNGGTSLRATVRTPKLNCPVDLRNAPSVAPDPLFVEIDPQEAERIVSSGSGVLHVRGRFRLVSWSPGPRRNQKCGFEGELLELSLFTDRDRRQRFVQLPKGAGALQPVGSGGSQASSPAGASAAKPAPKKPAAPVNRRVQASKLAAKGKYCEAIEKLMPCVKAGEQRCKDQVKGYSFLAKERGIQCTPQ